MDDLSRIIEKTLRYYPDVQAIYLFGSWGTDEVCSDSDVDIAILLPPAQAVQIKSLAMSDLMVELSDMLMRDVDLINLRRVSTVFQMEIITADRRIYCANEYASDEFEMLTLSYYQKLNEERKEIVEEFLNSCKKERKANPA